MSLSRTTLLFFDASCLFAAAGSPKGGSAYLISVCSRGYLQAVVSPDVLIEAERNILDKLIPEAFYRYRDIVSSTNFLVISTPSKQIVRQYEAIFFEDAHVIASSLISHSEFLITLDQNLERRTKDANLETKAISPGEFLQTVFPTHPEFSQIRQQR